MLSASSHLISSITAFRNPNGPEQNWILLPVKEPANFFKVALAEIGYLLVIPFAIVETALSAIAKLFSLCLPINEVKQEMMSEWLQSSAFSVGRALIYTLINPCCNDLVETEKVAQACAASGSLFVVPLEALVP